MSTANCPVEYAEMTYTSGINEGCVSGVYECDDCKNDFTEYESARHKVTAFYWRPEFLPKAGYVMPTMVMQLKRHMVDMCNECVVGCSVCGECIEQVNDALHGVGITYLDPLTGKREEVHAMCAGGYLLACMEGGLDTAWDVDQFTKDEIAALAGGAR